MDKPVSKISDQFMTPPDVIELARKSMGSIDVDPASNYVAQNYVQASTFCIAPDDTESHVKWTHQGHKKTLLIDGLAQPWHGSVWLNPPYSNGNIELFVDKAITEWIKNRVTNMIMLVNSSTDTKWFHKLCSHADLGLFWSGRIKFWKIFDGKAHEKWEGELSKQRGTGKIGNSPRFLNTLFFFGRSTDDLNTYRLIFDGKGTFFETL